VAAQLVAPQKGLNSMSKWKDMAVALFKAGYYTGICISGKPQGEKSQD
jgi:hypothetical protein